MRVAWTFEEEHTDPVTTYEMEINPQSVVLPAVRKTFTPQQTTAGGNVIFQGRNAVKEMSFTGTILTQEQYESMRDWVSKQKQIKITDDFGNEYWVYFTSFNPTRRRSTQFPWRHDYTASGIVLSWNVS